MLEAFVFLTCLADDLFLVLFAVVALTDVLTEAGRLDISRDAAEDIIEALCRDGRLMRPGGYDTLQPV